MERLTFEGNFCDIAQCRELPCRVGADMIDQIFPDCPRLMKNVRPAIVYVCKGTVYNMALGAGLRTYHRCRDAGGGACVDRGVRADGAAGSAESAKAEQ